jgi:hypothetical protein
MTQHYNALRNTAAVVLMLFPILMMLAFSMHFPSLSSFFNFRSSYGVYDPGKLFDMLVAGHGHSFVMAHFTAFLTVPLALLTIFTMSWFLYIDKPFFAAVFLITGIIGCMALAAVFGAWLSFSGIATVDTNNYEGARIGFMELVKMKGMLKILTIGSYLSFISIMLLAAGLIFTEKFNTWSMLSIITGCLLFIVFMDLDNWMFLGALFLFIGFIPIHNRLRLKNS